MIINIEKRHLYLLAVFIGVFAIAGIALAVVPNPGHSGAEIESIPAEKVEPGIFGNALTADYTFPQNLVVSGNANLQNDVAVGNDLTTSGASNFQSVTAAGDLSVSGASDVQTVTAAGDVTVSGMTRTEGGLVIETRTDDPVNPEVGMIWLRSDTG